jgi:ABC-type lipoprotein release transport system permease subunit
VALPLYYNWRNLAARKVSTGLTFVVVSVVVFVLALLLSFAAGIRASLVASGAAHNVVVLKPGATAESLSILWPDELTPLVQTPGLARLAEPFGTVPAGTTLMSPEICVQTLLPRTGSGRGANVAVRGVDDVAFAVHTEVRLVGGSPLRQGAPEALVGVAARDQYDGLAIGDEIPLGRRGDRRYKVVGYFEAGGGALESEIWVPRTVLADSMMRNFLSTVRLRVDNPELAPAAVAFVNSPAVGLAARSEVEYYRDLATKTREIVALTTILIAIMAIGAVFAVANTMYSAVDGRRREIAMLRTIGFNRRAIMTAFVLESMLLCTLACAAGLGATLLLSGTRQDFLSNATWTVLVYELRLTPTIVAAALGVSVFVGVIGALAPAIRAARINILQAVRRG